MKPVRHFLTELDLTIDETKQVLDDAKALKAKREQRNDLNHRHIALYFEKPSVRTRVSFTVGIHELGGQVVELGGQTTKVGKGEHEADFAKVLSGYVSMLVARVFEQSKLEAMAENGKMPVINALSDDRHPCQALADMQAIIERKGKVDGLKLAFVGAGNNVAASTGLLAAALGAEVVVASPEGYGLRPHILEAAGKLSGSMKQVVDVDEAIKKADVLYTDTWVSMGQEGEGDALRSVFGPYRISMETVKRAAKDAIVMHCLPAVRGEEIDVDVMYSESSAIWAQAENRLHAQKALIRFLIA